MSVDGVETSFEAISNDGTMRIEAVKTPGDIHVFDIQQSAPTDSEYYKIIDTLKSEAKERDPDEAEQVETHLRFGVLAHNGLVPRIGRVQNYAGLVAGLGYGFDRQTSTVDGLTQIHQTFRYPSVDRLNAFMEEVFGGEDGLRFIEHDGGDFSAEECIRIFAEEGRILVGGEEPYARHDLTDHALGWIGMNPELSKILRERLVMYLERNDAELKLPRAPISDKTNDEVRAFLNPSSVVIESASRSLDLFTDQLAGIVFFSERESGIFDQTDVEIGSAITGLFGNIKFEFGQSELQALGKSPDETFGAFPGQIISRYEEADRFYSQGSS